jgi:transposase-like protein
VNTNKKESFADWLDRNKCAEILREERWGTDPVTCVYCGSSNVTVLGKYKEYFYRYKCLDCSEKKGKATTFNDKTNTLFENSKISIEKWFYAINLVQKKVSDNEISRDLQVDGNTGRRMGSLIRGSLYVSVRTTVKELANEVEIDEAYVTAGCKGNNKTRPEDRNPRKRSLKKKDEGHMKQKKCQF